MIFWIVTRVSARDYTVYVTSWETVGIANVTWVVSFFMNLFKVFLPVTLLSDSWKSSFSHAMIQHVFSYFFLRRSCSHKYHILMVSFSHELILDVFLFHTFGSSCSCKYHIWMVSFSHELMPNVYSYFMSHFKKAVIKIQLPNYELRGVAWSKRWESATTVLGTSRVWAHGTRRSRLMSQAL